MRLRLGWRTHDSCEHWFDMPLSSTEAGPDNATVDRYTAQAALRPGESDLAAFERIRGRLLRYDVFPPLLFRGVVCPDGAIVPGATIVQRLLLGPLTLEMAVRVHAVWDRQTDGVREAGFSYVTLAGHVEQGVASFQVAHDAGGRVTVTLESRSVPGMWMTRVGRPVARRVQQGMTRRALRRLCG